MDTCGNDWSHNRLKERSKLHSIKRTLIPASTEIDYYFRAPKDDFPLIIFLHGFGETFGHLLRHFEKKIPPHTGILAVNGVFPLPQKKFDSPEWKLRFCWYFYDAVKTEYFINQRYPAEVLSGLIQQLNLEKMKKVIVGYSQGGYLAPFLGEQLENVQSCISINGEYKHQLLPQILPFPIINICGEQDEVVDPTNCHKSHEIMTKRGNSGDFYLVKETGHQINNNIIKLVINEINSVIN